MEAYSLLMLAVTVVVVILWDLIARGIAEDRERKLEKRARAEAELEAGAISSTRRGPTAAAGVRRRSISR
jgi:hypothetical protein